MAVFPFIRFIVSYPQFCHVLSCPMYAFASKWMAVCSVYLAALRIHFPPSPMQPQICDILGPGSLYSYALELSGGGNETSS